MVLVSVWLLVFRNRFTIPNHKSPPQLVACLPVEPERNGSSPHSDKRGGLNGSVQHLLAVYLPESEIPKFFLGADLIAVPPRRAPLENTLTSLFF